MILSDLPINILTVGFGMRSCSLELISARRKRSLWLNTEGSFSQLIRWIHSVPAYIRSC